MRNITKRTEPERLAQHRLTPHSDYNNYQDKNALREALVEEQRGLCCYCLQPIQADDDKMKIEHWHSKTRYPGEQLTYWNLLGACKGSEGQPESDQHCDTFKGEKDLSRNPANQLHNVEALIRYLPNGRITSSNTEFDAELNNVLNLNVAYLVNSRKNTLRALQRTLAKRPTLTRQSWERLLAEWSGDSHFGHLKPFCSVIVYWIKKTKLDRTTP